MKNNGERIKMIISQFCKSKADFARKVGESPQTVSNWVSRDNGMNVLNKIIEAFPDVNSDWLMTGHGSMIKEDSYGFSENTDNKTYTGSDNIKEISQYEMPTINEMIKVISLLSEQGKENAQANKINAEANKINAEANDRNSRNMERMMEMLEKMFNQKHNSQEEEEKRA